MKNIVYDNRGLHVKYSISMIYPLDHLQTVPASCYDFSVDLYTFCKSDIRGLTTEKVCYISVPNMPFKVTSASVRRSPGPTGPSPQMCPGMRVLLGELPIALAQARTLSNCPPLKALLEPEVPQKPKLLQCLQASMTFRRARMPQRDRE
jgi:hypothetical protein